MRLKICTIIFFLFSICQGLLLAQKIDTAQLLMELEGEASPRGRLLILSALAKAYLRNDPQRAWDFAVEAEAQAQALQYDSIRGRLRLLLGEINWQRGRYEAARENAHQALSMLEEDNDSTGVAEALWLMGKIDFRWGIYPQALRFHIQAQNIQQHLPDPLAEGHSWLWQGIVRAEIGQYEEARNCYGQSLKLAREARDTLLMGDTYNHIARSWRKEEDYEKARAYQELAGKIYRTQNDALGLSDYYNNMGSIFRRQGRLDSALHYFVQGLQIQQTLDDQEGLADGYNDIGTTYLQLGQADFAIRNLKKGLEIARRTGLKDDIRYAYASLSKAYEANGDYRAAVEAWKKLNAISDTLLNQETTRKITELAFQHEREKARQDLKLFQTQSALDSKHRQQILTLFIAGAGILLVIALGLLFHSRLQTRLNRDLARTNREIEDERARSENLLLNILPEATAAELKETGQAQTHYYKEVSVLFSDFMGFSQLSEKMSPQELIEELDECFSAFDEIITRFGLEKIKTIGDAYMCASGLPQHDPDNALLAAQAAWEMQSYLEHYGRERAKAGKPFFQARIGIHTGPVVAGVVGKKKFAYDIWGYTVNIASRLESNGAVGRINVSGATFQKIQQHFICEYRGRVPAKNIGEIEMYFLKWKI